MKYALTITVSPYKKVKTCDCAYKVYKHEYQKHILSYNLAKIMATYGITKYEFHYEECPTSKLIHSHGNVELPDDADYPASIGDLLREIWTTFGYQGKNNKIEHTVLCKVIFDEGGWNDYSTKDQKNSVDLMTVPITYEDYPNN